MKRSIHVALFLLFFLGCVHAAYPGSTNFDFDAGSSCTNSTLCAAIYNAQDCPGITAHFQSQPIPTGAIDAANGREIAGYDIVCDGIVVVSAGGAGGGDTRDVVRSFGFIRVRYR